jgi:hypothetical protein
VLVKPTRQTQPVRKGPRQPSLALYAAPRGRTAGGWSSADIWRKSARMARAASTGARGVGRSARHVPRDDTAREVAVPKSANGGKRNKRRRAREEAYETFGRDQSTVIYGFGDGWSIRHL